MRPLPKNINEFKPGNNIVSVKFALKITNALNEGILSAQESMKNLKNEDILNGLLILAKLTSIQLPS